MLLSSPGGASEKKLWRARWPHVVTTERPELLRKEVIQPQVPLRLPCYDFTPITNHTLGACLLAVGAATSGTAGFRGVTGGVYKARERIQRSLLICAY
jgi:hypothetical protein